MIIDDIRRSQGGNQQATLDLIEKFKPALNAYARKLETEDAYHDLVLEFLQILRSINCDAIRFDGDGAMVNYLSQAIYHAYIKLLQRLIKNKFVTVSMDDITDLDLYQNDQYLEMAPFPLDVPGSLLTRKEKLVLYRIHVMGYSAAEVAHAWGTTRQSVNQMKLRAEKKLRNYLIQSGQEL